MICIEIPYLANCFRFSVAHRLRTVIDYDRLIVLDKGQV